jgi:hypothetical protein
MNKTRGVLSQRITNLTLSALLVATSIFTAVPFLLSSAVSALPTTVFSQGFETDTTGYSSGGSYGSITQVASGNNGIASASGNGHAVVESTAYGPFTAFDQYRDTWTGEWNTSTNVYLDTNWLDGEGFEYSVAANGSNGLHQRDFVAHVSKDTSTGDLLFAGSNNAGFTANQNLESGNHYVVTASGWYTIEHVFREDSGQLAVDINLLDESGVLFTETRSSALDLIPAEVGGNRYGWFTFADVTNGLAIDNAQLSVEPPDTTDPEVTSFSQNYQPKSGGRIAVTLTFSEDIVGSSLGQGWNNSGDSGTNEFTKIYYSTKEHTVTFLDLPGNEGSYTFNVDFKAPTVVDEVQKYETKDGGRIAVFLTFSEPINPDSMGQGWYAVSGSNNTEFKKVYYSLKDHTIEFEDTTGNPGTYSFTVQDKSEPNITFSNVAVSQDKLLSFDLEATDTFSGLEIVAANIYNESNTGEPVIKLGENSAGGTTGTTRLNVPYAGLPEKTMSFTSNQSGIDVSGLESGIYTIRAFARDHANNDLRFATYQFIVDNTAPEVTVVTPVEAVAGDSVTFEGTIVGDYDTITFTLNGVDYTPVVVGENWTVDVDTTGFTPDDYTGTIVAKDAAGNTSVSDATTTVAFTVNPEPEVLGDNTEGTNVPGTDNPPNTTPQSRGTSTPTITGPVNDNEVLGETSDDEASQNGETDVEGTNSFGQAVTPDSDQNQGTFAGLAWYWWLLIIAAVATLIGLITRGIRNRAE